MIRTLDGHRSGAANRLNSVGLASSQDPGDEISTVTVLELFTEGAAEDIVIDS
jgi:hypothetical protein